MRKHTFSLEKEREETKRKKKGEWDKRKIDRKR